jgi:DNA-binding IscR family transcriptional regulator
MSDVPPPESFDDVNEAVVQEWTQETSPYTRVRQIISSVYTPLSVATIADRASVSEKTARKHLTTLADEGFVSTQPGEHGATLYARSSESLVVEQATDILEELSVPELRDQVSELRSSLREFQEKYDAESPEELAVRAAEETLIGQSIDHEQVDVDLLEWKTIRRNLAFANAALSISSAQQFISDENLPSKSSVSS